MKILCLSHDLTGASLCARLLREGNEVRALVADPLYGQILDGLLDKVATLDEGLAWVEKDGLIVVDDVGFGELQDRLRAEGYAVVGGSAGGDLLEKTASTVSGCWPRTGSTRCPATASTTVRRR